MRTEALPDEDDLRALLAERTARAGRSVAVRGARIEVDDPAFRLPAQGWQIHVSARPATLAETVRRVLPALLDTPCRFTLVRDGRTLQHLNSSTGRPDAIGTAITVAAARPDVVALARGLAEALAGLTGPQVAAARRVHPDAPVYYRFAPFRAAYAPAEDGDYVPVVTDPSGVTHVPGGAWQPHWDPDPFTDVPQPRAPQGEEIVLGGRYRVERALTRSPKGRVYRTFDLARETTAIVKEARPHVDEDEQGRDARARLRNERYVLELLRDVEGVPRVLDHFRHDEREYLVVTDLGGRTLAADVAAGARYTAADPQGGRDLHELAVRLLALLDAIHGRGVIARDVHPANVILDAEHSPALVDFEIGRADDPPIEAWTRGYSSPAQERAEKPTRECDYYSLGATLFYAVTGVPPTWIPDDPHNHDTARAAEVLDGRGGMGGTILGLLSPDPADRRAAAAQLRAGRFTTAPAPVQHPDERARRLDAAIEHGLAAAARHARRLMAGRFGDGRVPGPVNVHRGAAGIGMELLQHDDRAETADLARDLAYWSAGFLALRDRRPGLYTGDTGTAVFVAAAGKVLGDDALLALADGLGRPDGAHTGDGQHDGLAGVGLGQWLLWEITGDPSRRDLAVRCAERLARAPRPDGLGYAHGLAGIVRFLLTVGTVEPAVRKGCDELAASVPALADASFCQGLAGVGAVLVRAGDAYLDAARAAAAACERLAPNLPAVTQCCGLAGVGELFLDLWAATGEEEHRRQADRVADLVLARAGGTPDAPVLPGSADWSTGTSGIVTFLRRLRSGAAPRLWVDPL
ncbi:Serine/threonine-protein kinase B [Actinomadura rubteroloni]|uniref:non-specific serine/threonine protein kinase n=1 Tax=Actinomadura rubteroloni TaxID=1926885 RepID=A0A2P4UPY6_9ACTN|nr:lanthionine synthetase LanC family protein [Actinomadura rubteroloni]POM27084.1 Serine/threonine-protein kinase B [Actinomadura rubteroloni]